MPYSGSLHIDSAMTNVSVMYRNAEFVIDQVFPVLPVDKQSDKFFVYGMDNLRPDNDARRPGALANEIDWNLSDAPYYCDGHALSSVIPDEWRSNADQAIDLNTDTTIMLTDKIFLNRELDGVAQIAAGCTPVTQAANQWDVDTTDPVKIIDVAKETVGMGIAKRPNSLLLSRPVFRGLRNNALVKARVGGALEGIGKSLITQAQLAVVLEVDNLIVADGIQVTSAEGQPITTSYIWGNTALLFYRPPSPGLRTVALGYSFTWNTGRLGSLVYTAREDKRHADWLEVQRYYSQQIIAAAAGYYFTNVVANF